ncbi:MAG: M24 family metallopeptidase [Bacillaceae bacterium]|nr:M24 family metallopeptidase [Bacillaceae bacterium]
MLHFTHGEFHERLRRTKEKMVQEGIEVLVVTDPANMNYLSGYNGWSFYVHQALIVIIDEPQPLWIGREMDANAAKVTSWLFHEHIIPYPDYYVNSNTTHPYDFIGNILKEIGQSKRVIGLEMDNYYFSAKCFQRLQKALPQAVFKDSTNLVNWVRIIKSDTEIEYMKRAGQIAVRAMKVGIEAIDVGVRECDVAAKIFEAQIKGTPEFGGDYPAIVPLMPAGEHTSTPHITWSDETYKPNTTVLIELAGCYQRYHAPLARTVTIGEPEEKVKDLSEVVIEGMEAALDVIKPGITCEEVERAWRKSIQKRGYQKESRIGYSVGLNYPPDWGEHTASLRPGDQTVLKPNMTFHMILGIWMDDYGVELSESFRVTKTGYELLASAPRKLFVKQAGKKLWPGGMGA